MCVCGKYLKSLINSISYFYCVFFCAITWTLPMIITDGGDDVVTNKLCTLFILFVHSTLFYHYYFFRCCIFVDYIKSKWVCHRARFYYIHCLTVQRAHVIFIFIFFFFISDDDVYFILCRKMKQHNKREPNIPINISKWFYSICWVFIYDNDWFALYLKMNDNIVAHTRTHAHIHTNHINMSKTISGSQKC